MKPKEDPILDPEETERLAQKGMAEVDANANEAWKKEALEAVYNAAIIHKTFIADQVWEMLSLSGCIEGVHNKSALGPVMVLAAKEGFIENTGEFQKSIRPRTHGRPLPIWRSLILK